MTEPIPISGACPAEPVVTLCDARKSFGANQVLKGISLEVCQGDVLAIIGPSGGGKSTLLRCLTLLETLDGGNLAYGDVQVCTEGDGGRAVYGGKDVLKQAKTRFGLVFQDFNLFPHYTVLKNVTDPLVSVLKMSKGEAEERGRALLAKMGLEGKETMVPCELSGGQQQRVAIARALDPELTREVLRVIRELAAEHMTMVIVTHEMSFARDVADKLIFMDGGQVVERGRAADVINAPTHERTRAFLSGYEGV